MSDRHGSIYNRDGWLDVELGWMPPFPLQTARIDQHGPSVCVQQRWKVHSLEYFIPLLPFKKKIMCRLLSLTAAG